MRDPARPLPLLAALVSACFSPDDAPKASGSSTSSSADSTGLTTETSRTGSASSAEPTSASEPTASADSSTSSSPGDASSPTSTDTSKGPACDNGEPEPGELCFDTVALVASSGRAAAAQLGDLDGDDLLDLIYFGSQGIEMRHGNGDGSFEAPVSGPSVLGNTLALGFVNAGSDPDVLVAHSASPGEALFYTGAEGLSLESGVSIPPGTAPSAIVALHDLDGDGDDDAVIAGRGDTSGSLVYARAEAGGLTPAGPSDGTFPLWGLVVGDVSGEGDADIVYASGGATTSGLYLRLGDGSVGFESQLVLDTQGVELRGVALGDVDGDDDLDIVYASNANNTITVLQNDGEGTFSRGATLTTSSPHAVALVDVTHDGALDIIVGHDSQTRVQVFRGFGTGNFDDSQDFETSSTGLHLAVGDINGDSIPDIVASGAHDPSLSILLSAP